MERKNYLSLGIILAIFAALVSLMCIAFSYADVNDLNAADSESVNESNGLAIKLEQQGISDEKFNQYCEIVEKSDPNNVATWNSATKQIEFENWGTSFRAYKNPEKPDCLYIVFSPGTGGQSNVTFQLNVTDTTRVSFDGWGDFSETTQTSNMTIYPSFTDLKPYDSAVISGKVRVKSTGDYLANVPVVLASKNSGEVYASTSTNSNGEYTLSNVNPQWITDTDNNPSFIYCSYPGYDMYYSPFLPSDPRIEGNIAYFEDNNMGLDMAEVNVSGADHHQVFDIDMTVHMPTGDQKWIFHLPFFGLENIDLNKGAEFVVDENGLITGTATTVYMGATITTDLKCQTKCDDGYKFSYLDLNGTRYNAGDPIVLDGVSEYTAVVNYEAVAQPENVTAQTGDAIPYAVVVGLCLLAIAAFSIARKQFNK